MQADQKTKLILLMIVAFLLFNFPIINVLDKQVAWLSMLYFFVLWLFIIFITYWLVEKGKR